MGGEERTGELPTEVWTTQHRSEGLKVWKKILIATDDPKKSIPPGSYQPLYGQQVPPSLSLPFSARSPSFFSRSFFTMPSLNALPDCRLREWNVPRQDWILNRSVKENARQLQDRGVSDTQREQKTRQETRTNPTTALRSASPSPPLFPYVGKPLRDGEENGDYFYLVYFLSSTSSCESLSQREWAER